MVINLITRRTSVGGGDDGKRGGRRSKKQAGYLASSSVMSVRLQDQPRCLRERSRRGDPATTGACTSRIYVTKMSKMRIGRGEWR